MSYLEERRNKILAGRPLPEKKKYTIPKKSEKRIKKEAEEAAIRGDGDTEKQKWFRARVKLMTGHCAETGLKTETKIFQYAIMSICHLLPQRLCPSVALHPLNWIELNVDFHVKFDAMSWEEKEKLGCWPIIQERLIHVWECLAPEERRHFPDSVRNYIEKNSFI